MKASGDHKAEESGMISRALAKGQSTLGERLAGRARSHAVRGLSPLRQALLVTGGFRETTRFNSIILVRPQGQENHFVTGKIDLEEIVFRGFTNIPCIPTTLVFERNRLA